MRSRTLTLQDAVESFLVALRADGVKPETISWYRHRLSRFIALYGKRDVRSISIDEVRAYIVMVRQMDFAPHTLFTLARVVRRLFKWLYEERKIDEGLHRRLKLPKLPQPVPKWIEMDDVMRLLGACGEGAGGKRDRAIMLFLLDTGCRVGGLCHLRMSHMDFEARRASLFEKGDKARMALFGERTAGAPRAWLEGRRFPGSDAAFTS